uniref:Uncharacterized protein n=1 Tax=Romanomermis culicivorax TaxID=13658 RepID=A0A915KTP6_ROMCU
MKSSNGVTGVGGIENDSETFHWCALLGLVQAKYNASKQLKELIDLEALNSEKRNGREKEMVGETGWSGKRNGRGKEMVGERAHNHLGATRSYVVRSPVMKSFVDGTR